ncbi:hypothetical protein K474DRAFT_1557027, partial [Panus rudis PR-1116 ss-1]
GRRLPRSDDNQRRELYCASVLMLLKPWRTFQELRPSNMSWEDSFQAFLRVAPRRTHQIIQNLQHYYRCSDA